MSDYRPGAGLASAARCLALDRSAADVVRMLSQHDIASVVLKGAGLARRLYADPSQRSYTDVDLLVSPDDFDRVERALAASGYTDASAGFRADELLWREHAWLTPGPGTVHLDLHRSFLGVGDATRFWQVIGSAAQSLELGGGLVLVPDAAGCALVVALHAAADGPGGKSWTDLNRALEGGITPGEWAAAATLARDTGSESSFAVGLRTATAGVALASELGLQSTPTLREQLKSARAQQMTHSLAQLVSQRGPTTKARHVARRLVPSKASMRRTMLREGRGQGTLVGAYARRWVRLARRTPGAWLELRSLTTGSPSLPRGRRATAKSAVTAVATLTARELLVCVWAVRALHDVRRQLLRQTPLGRVRLPGPPRASGARSARVVRRTLAVRGASCLQRSLVLQRWAGSQAQPLDLVIGVSTPAGGFHAHAWLESPAREQYRNETEIYRRPMPVSWLVPR